jgi:hypothetical protein
LDFTGIAETNQKAGIAQLFVDGLAGIWLGHFDQSAVREVNALEPAQGLRAIFRRVPIDRDRLTQRQRFLEFIRNTGVAVASLDAA